MVYISVIFIVCKIGKILCLNEVCRDKPYNFRLGECPGCRFAGSEASDRHQCGPTPSPTCAAGLGPSPSLTKYIWKFCFRNLVWDPNRCIYVTTVIQIPDILNLALYRVVFLTATPRISFLLSDFLFGTEIGGGQL